MSKGSLYYLIEEDGRSRTVVNGVVTSINKKTPVRYAPIGYQDIMIIWERMITRYAQVRNFSLPLGFVRDAAMILRNDMYQFNIDRKLFLLIQKFRSTIDSLFFRDRYEFLYKGELDFSTFEDVPGEMRANINIMEGGNSKLLKANENTQFLIPFDEDAINIEMDGIRITGIYQYTLPEDSNVGGQWVRGMIKVGDEQKAPGIATFDLYGGVLFNPAQVLGAFSAANTEYFMQVNVAPDSGTMNISGTIRLSNPTPPSPANITLKIFNVVSGTQRLSEDIFSGPEAAEIPINYDVTLQVGDRLFLTIDEPILQSELTFTLKTRHPTTIIKAFKPIDVFKKLCLKLGIPVSKAVSNILSESTIMLTSGDGIRGIENTDVGIKTSFNDFFKAFDVYLMLGCSVRDTIKIEDRLEFFRSTDPVILGEVAGFKTIPADDLMYSSIKVGHKEQDIEDVNGKYDFNGHMIFTTPVKRGGGKEMDLVSPYKAGPYEIESIRANLDGKDTTDSTRDNQVFAIACADAQDEISTTVSFINSATSMIFPNGIKLVAGMRISITGSAAGNDREYIIQGVASILIAQIAILDVSVADESNVPVTIAILSGQVYQIDRSITVTSGVPDPETIFNVPLSPKRLLRAHYRWTRSWCWNYEPESLVFQQANRNSDLEAGGIIEKANVPIASMGTPIFKPFYHEFKTRVPVDLTTEMDEDPEAPFMPTWLGDEFNGFLWRAGISPNSSTPQIFKILSAHENDLTRLIA